MIRPQWWLDATAVDVLALCEYLAERPSNSNPDYIDDFVAPSGSQDFRRLIGVAEALRLVRSDPRWADAEHTYDPVLISSSGLRRIAEVYEHRERRGERITAARQGMLLWTYEHAVDNPELPMNRPSRFMESDSAFNFWGEPFTGPQVREASEYLIEAGLLELFGQRLAGGEPQNVQVTRLGKDCVEQYDGRVTAYLARRATAAPTVNNQTFHGPVNGQVAQGASVTQTQNQGVSIASLAVSFEAMREAVGALSDTDDRDDFLHGLRELEIAVERDDRKEVERRAGRLKRLGNRLGSDGLASATAEGVRAVLQAFGID